MTRDAASRARWTIRPGGAATRRSRGSASPSTCRRRGGISTPPPISPPISPTRTIIINHTALAVGPQRGGSRRLAHGARPASREHANVALKISGIGLRGAPWEPRANVPVIRDAIAIFGAERCMFASNYPVDSLVAPYGAILAAFRAAIADRPLAEQAQLLARNAERIYRIPTGEHR